MPDDSYAAQPGKAETYPAWLGQTDMRKFEPADRSQHLADLLAQLYQLESLVQAADREEILRQVADMDWHCIADEFESVVARCCHGIAHHARRIIHNLLRPYVRHHDCIRLADRMRLLDQALEDSPSLHADADSEVAETWQRQLERARLRHQIIREMPAVTTLDGLRETAAAKIALGQLLEGRLAAFVRGEPVPYADLLPYLPLPQEN